MPVRRLQDMTQTNCAEHFFQTNQSLKHHGFLEVREEGRANPYSTGFTLPTSLPKTGVKHTVHSRNRPDGTMHNRSKKEIIFIPFSCRWVSNKETDYQVKTKKYQKLRKESKARIEKTKHALRRRQTDRHEHP